MSKHTHQIATDFEKTWRGKFEDDKLDAITARIEDLSTADAISANGEIASLVLYVKGGVTLEDGSGDVFRGDAGGAFTPGGGALFGDVYTDDLTKLIANTSRFEVNAAAAYTSFLFFDDDSNLLGHFESGSVSTVIGVGGGTGSWQS